MNKKLKILLILLLLAFLTNSLFAQEFRIKGTVTDRITNETIPGVTVLIEGTSIGTVTGVDGEFELIANRDTISLQLSHISYKTLAYVVNRKSGFLVNIGIISLYPAIQYLDEVKIISSFVTDRNTPIAVSTVKLVL